MPKVIVMFVGDEASAEAEVIASGAKTVRFTEVDVRAARETTTRFRPFAPQDGVIYDGAVLVSSDSSGDSAAIELVATCTNEHTVFGGPGAASLSAAQRVGGIVVMSRANDAKATGARVAKVAGWVRHSLGHEAEHAHDHSHTHEHTHAHSHEHGHEPSHEHGHSHEHARGGVHPTAEGHHHGHGHDHPHVHGNG